MILNAANSMKQECAELQATMERHAPKGYDPAGDDMTIPFAIKLAEQDTEIAKLRAALRPFAEAAAGIPDSVSDAKPFFHVSQDAKCRGTTTSITVSDMRVAAAAVKNGDQT